MKKTLGWLLIVAMFLPFLAGCGRGEYEKRLEAGIGQAKKGSAFGAMQPPVTLAAAGTSLQVRLPPALQQVAQGDDKRINPPGYRPEGLAATYEGFVTDSTGGKIHYYCYLGAEKLNPQSAEHFEYYIKTNLEQAFPEAAVQWQNASATTETGAAVEWRKVRVEARQDFYYVDAAGAESYRADDGFFELWVRKEGNMLLKVAWRMPNSLKPSAEFDKWAPRVAGTMTLEAG